MQTRGIISTALERWFLLIDVSSHCKRGKKCPHASIKSFLRYIWDFFLKIGVFPKDIFFFLFAVSHTVETYLLRAKPDYSWHSFSLLFRYTAFEWRCRNLVWGLQKVMMAADAFKQDAVLWRRKTESNQSWAEYSCTSTMNQNLVVSHVLTSFVWEKGIDFFGVGGRL